MRPSVFMSRRRCSSPQRSSRRERLDLQAGDGAEVLDVGGDEREPLFDGGGADQGIGHAHAVRQGERVDQVGCALRDGWCERQHFGLPRGEPLLQPREVGLVAATLRVLRVRPGEAGVRSWCGMAMSRMRAGAEPARVAASAVFCS